MNTEDLVVNNGREREEVKHLGAVLPDIRRAVFPQALVVEAIDLRKTENEPRESEKE